MDAVEVPGGHHRASPEVAERGASPRPGRSSSGRVGFARYSGRSRAGSATRTTCARSRWPGRRRTPARPRAGRDGPRQSGRPRTPRSQGLEGERGDQGGVDAAREGDQGRAPARGSVRRGRSRSFGRARAGGPGSFRPPRGRATIPFALRAHATCLRDHRDGPPDAGRQEGTVGAPSWTTARTSSRRSSGSPRRKAFGPARSSSGSGCSDRRRSATGTGRQYKPHELTVPHEVVALHGTIAWADGNPSLHLHGALAGPDHHLVGGHLLRATVGHPPGGRDRDLPGRTLRPPAGRERRAADARPRGPGRST